VTPDSFTPFQQDISLRGHALQCRVTTEDPENGFTARLRPIAAYRSAAGFGIRLDAGTAYAGAVITPYYDSLLVKVTAWGHTPDEAAQRMDRALREFRVRGLATNLQFLENVIAHPLFRSGECTTRFIENTPELFNFTASGATAPPAAQVPGDVAVNGNPEMKGRTLPQLPPKPADPPVCDLRRHSQRHTRPLKELGPSRFAQWMLGQPQVLLTDTTMRDAHQSLFATRMRTADMLAIAPHYARMLPQLFSMECWGGATFRRGAAFPERRPVGAPGTQLREAMPNILFQMLLRAQQRGGLHQLCRQRGALLCAAGGQERRRCVPRVRLAQLGRQHARGDGRGDRTGALCEGAICYTGDLFDAKRQVRPEVLRRPGQTAGKGRRPHSGHQGHGRRVPPACGARWCGCSSRRSACRSISTPTTPAAFGGLGAGGD
jgi:pyruvate carboxylase